MDEQPRVNEWGHDFPTNFAALNAELAERGEKPTDERAARAFFEKGWFYRPAVCRIWAKRKGLR